MSGMEKPVYIKNKQDGSLYVAPTISVHCPLLKNPYNVLYKRVPALSHISNTNAPLGSTAIYDQFVPIDPDELQDKQ